MHNIIVVIQSLSHVRRFATPWTAACQASLSFTISQSWFKLKLIESVMPSNHLILCHTLLLLPSIFPSIRVFSNELAICIRYTIIRYYIWLWHITTIYNICAVLCLVTQSCQTLCNPMDCSPPGSSVHGDSLGKNIGGGYYDLFQGIFPTSDQTQVSCIAGGFFTIWATRWYI